MRGPAPLHGVPVPVGRLAAERRGAEMAKRQFLFAAKWAAALGPALEQRQEVLAALADCAIEVYAMDSMLARTLACEDRVELRDALCRFFCMESREKAFDRARTAVCAVVPAEGGGGTDWRVGRHRGCGFLLAASGRGDPSAGGVPRPAPPRAPGPPDAGAAGRSVLRQPGARPQLSVLHGPSCFVDHDSGGSLS